MRDLLDALERWADEGRKAAVARVVNVEGRVTPRMGAALAVNDTGEVAGSLDQPGAEAAIVPAAQAMIEGGAPATVTSLEAHDVLLAPAEWDVLVPLAQAMRAGRDVALAAQVRGPAIGASMLVGGHGRLAGSLGDERLDTIAGPDALGALALRRTTTHTYGRHGERRGDEVTVFVESFNRPARLIVLGATGLTSALVTVASAAGFRVVVCDPRPGFATRERYPGASAVVTADLAEQVRTTVQLGPTDAICVLTNDTDAERAAVVAALATRVGFVAAAGGGRTTAERSTDLRAAGMGDDALDRLTTPVPSPVDGRVLTPGELAVALCAQIALGRSSGPAPPLPSFR